HSVAYEVTDGQGMSDDCSFTVTVVDNEPPVFPAPPSHLLTTEAGATCPSPADISLTASQATPITTGGTPFNFTVHGLSFPGPANYTDNCASGADLRLFVWSIDDDLNNDADAYSRTYRIEWRVVDASGLTQTRFQDFTIIDNTPPVLVCETGLTLDFNGEDYFALADFLGDLIDLDQSEDECGDTYFGIEPTFITCDQLGEVVEVTITACDGASNCTSCIVPVTVDGLPCGWMTWDGHIDCPGSSADYDVPTETFTVTSNDCSHSPYSPLDEEYAYVKTVICSDGEIIAQVTDLDGLGKAWAGITMRESNDPGSKKFQVMTGLDYLQHRADWRSSTGGTNQTQSFSRYGQHWLRIVRTGDIFQAYTSYNGVTWGQPVNTQIIPMNDCLEVGLIVTNVPYATNVTASFNHVQTSPPYVPEPPPALSCNNDGIYDDVCDADCLTLGVAYAFSNAGATVQPGEVHPGIGTDASPTCNSTDGWCNIGSEPSVNNSVWFQFTAPPSGCVDISALDADLQLAVWSAGDCNNFGSFIEIGANDDSGPNFAPFLDNLSVIPGEVYWVQIDGYNGALETNGQVLVEDCAAPIAACEAATPINCGDVVIGSTVGGQALPGLPFCGTALNTAPGNWYVLEGTGTEITVSTCNPGSNYDTKIGVFNGGCNLAILNCIGGNDDDFGCGFSILRSTVTFNTVIGVSYYIYVTGFSTAVGTYELSVDCAPPRPGDQPPANPQTELSPLSATDEVEVGHLFPNPTDFRTQLDIRVPQAMDGQIQVFDQLGSLAYRQPLDLLEGPNRISLSLGNLSSGTYFVKVVVGEKIFHQKLVLVK
ncbi:MAG: T9SS type A sorting domain-containing protein, partial [Lewinella sp.]|nr:T9SS type A sorting domain-containing protein [Lewinella sp.]